jgi:hypothetical protein
LAGEVVVLLRPCSGQAGAAPSILRVGSVQKSKVCVIFTGCLTLILSLAAGLQPRVAKADPGCAGAYVLFARGSNEGFDDKRAHRFYWSLVGSDQNPGLLRQRGLSVAWAELGNLDNDIYKIGSLEPGEYPAVASKDWITGNPNYGQSVEIGTNELVAHLNDRTQRCPHEAIVLGGYSQGADVIGWALERQGYGSLTQRVKDNLAFVALYGDPRNNFMCGDIWWTRIATAHCGGGVLRARSPYLPAELRGRAASWCANGDGICHGSPVPGSHNTAYQDYIIAASAPEIADRAVTKAIQLQASDLFFIKTKSTASGNIEIHNADAVDSFRYGWLHAVTYLSSANQDSGWFQMVGLDLYFIKTSNTNSGLVEIHTATFASNYQSGQHWTSRFSIADQHNGWFQMMGDTLFFIKTRHTDSGAVEVHAATRASSYQSGQDNHTWLSVADADNGWYQIVGSNLYFIKTRQVDSGRVEVHAALAVASYQSGPSVVTSFSPADQDNGWYQLEGEDLYFIKTRNTDSGVTEIHSKVGVSTYQSGLSVTTYLNPADQHNGWFQVGGK